MTQAAFRPQAYQLLPALDIDQRDQLRQSIEELGILQPIEVDEDGRILDGHHRQAIAAELGIACPSRTISNLDENAKRRYALTVNLMRRQLGKEARAGLIAQLRQEGMSVRAIASATGITKSTVASDISQLSRSGQLDQPTRISGLDGKTRAATQPKSPVADDLEPRREREAPVRADGPVSGESESNGPDPDLTTSTAPALPWPVAQDVQPEIKDEPAHAARVSNDIRRLITLAQTFGSEQLRAQAVRLYADNLGNQPMPPSGVVSAQELRKAADAIAALAKEWSKKK